ncbi:carbohydrate kinase family protein [Candidatus Gracilibacteria bacterium]|nr:carbohydrate kinase family protein [Candidatus Gracilibacteria bacterium]
MKSPKYDILTFGSVTLDIFLLPEKADVHIEQTKDGDTFLFPVGAKIPVGEVLRAPGGGAANTAVGFSKMGLSTALFGVLGDDEEAHLIQKKLKTLGIDTSNIVCQKDAHSSFSIILMAPDGRRTVFHSRQANVHFRPHSLRSAPLAKAVYVSHLYGDSQDLLFGIPHWKEKTGGLVAWNPGKTQFHAGFQTFETVFPHVDLLIMNREEAEMFSGVQARKISLTNQDSDDIAQKLGQKIPLSSEFRTAFLFDMRKIAQKFLQAGVKNVVITDGNRGAQLFCSDGSHFRCASPDVEVKSTLGAGDAFSVGIITALLHKEPSQKQILWGTLNAGGVIQKFGAQEGFLMLRDIKKAT